jgi:gluconate 2-dehydrogenase gamma chain
MNKQDSDIQLTKADRQGISRREFISRVAVLSSLLAACPASTLAQSRKLKKQPDPDDESMTWSAEPVWQTIAQVQNTLFPAAEDIPGASDFGADVYLYRALVNPGADAEDRQFIFRGVGWLDDLTLQQYKKNFRHLSSKLQQQTIEQIVNSRAGRNWVSMLLAYILEALLADPVYGGNKNGAGWKWLQHQPGYPSPVSDKTWDQLQQRRFSE